MYVNIIFKLLNLSETQILCFIVDMVSKGLTPEATVPEADIVDTQSINMGHPNARFKLRMNEVTLMIAEFVTDSREEIVYGHALKKGDAKYPIKSCYLTPLMKWNAYKPSEHVPGAYIAWSNKHTVKAKCILISLQQSAVHTESPTTTESEKKILPSCKCKYK